MCILLLIARGSRFIVWFRVVNPLWPSDAKWRHITGSTLAQVTVRCLTAPGHYLSQWRLGTVLWRSPANNFTANAQSTVTYKDITVYNEFENYNFKIIDTSPRDNESSTRRFHPYPSRLLFVARGNQMIEVIPKDVDEEVMCNNLKWKYMYITTKSSTTNRPACIYLMRFTVFLQ